MQVLEFVTIGFVGVAVVWFLTVNVGGIVDGIREVRQRRKKR